MSETLIAKRAGYDIDDTLVGAELLTRVAGFIKGKTAHNLSVPFYSVSMPDLNHTPIKATGINSILLWFHTRRAAIPGTVERLKTRANQGEEAFAISGRPAFIDWHEGTANQLAREGFPIPPERLILTPKGEKTAVSKAHAIKKLRIEEYSDNDLPTILLNSLLYPEVMFNWIRHGITNIPVDEVILAARDNVRIVPIKVWSNEYR